jgi:hypothetical protein
MSDYKRDDFEDERDEFEEFEEDEFEEGIEDDEDSRDDLDSDSSGDPDDDSEDEDQEYEEDDSDSDNNNEDDTTSEVSSDEDSERKKRILIAAGASLFFLLSLFGTGIGAYMYMVPDAPTKSRVSDVGNRDYSRAGAGNSLSGLSGSEVSPAGNANAARSPSVNEQPDQSGLREEPAAHVRSDSVANVEQNDAAGMHENKESGLGVLEINDLDDAIQNRNTQMQAQTTTNTATRDNVPDKIALLRKEMDVMKQDMSAMREMIGKAALQQQQTVNQIAEQVNMLAKVVGELRARDARQENQNQQKNSVRDSVLSDEISALRAEIGKLRTALDQQTERINVINRRSYTAIANSRLALNAMKEAGVTVDTEKDWRTLQSLDVSASASSSAESIVPDEAVEAKAASLKPGYNSGLAVGTIESGRLQKNSIPVYERSGVARHKENDEWDNKPVIRDWKLLSASDNSAIVSRVGPAGAGMTFDVRVGSILPGAGRILKIDVRNQRVIAEAGIITSY